jgi:hypothetical protein
VPGFSFLAAVAEDEDPPLFAPPLPPLAEEPVAALELLLEAWLFAVELVVFEAVELVVLDVVELVVLEVVELVVLDVVELVVLEVLELVVLEVVELIVPWLLLEDAWLLLDAWLLEEAWLLEDAWLLLVSGAEGSSSESVSESSTISA